MALWVGRVKRLALMAFTAAWLAGISVFLLSNGSSRNIPRFAFEVNLRSSVNGTAQLFYDIGQGIREEDSSRVVVRKSDTLQLYHFPLPAGRYRSFRFDPLDKEGKVLLSGAKIIDSAGVTIRELPAAQIIPLQQIQIFNLVGEAAHIETTSDANDPMLQIRFDTPLVLSLPGQPSALQRSLLQLLLCFLVISGGLWLGEELWVRHQRQVVTWWRRMLLRQQQHSSRFIIGVAVIAVVMSCYPVVFCGRSFVSPNFSDGTLLLYDHFPTLPGYTDTATESAAGSDVGAMAWAHRPYSVIESRALFQDHELPLWNRYNSGGEALLGQGQSMFGDPLHALVLLSGGAAWAWDVKYVSAKIFFVCGLGLIVYAVTNHLPASLAITFASAFIGFFSFRFNHPAFFSMSYAPWLLYCWIKISQARTTSKSTVWIGGLIAGNWAEMSSGTVKEAYMLLLCLNWSGLLFFLLITDDLRLKRRKLRQLLGAGVLFILIGVPLWLTLLHTLQQAYTAYDRPHAWQIQPGLLIGLFDDIFYRQLNEGETVFEPSANFFILFGLLWSVVRLRENLINRSYLAVSCAAVLPFVFAFGVIPQSIIVQIPFLGNVAHIGNTFSCVLIVHLIVLAGIGMQQCWDRRTEKDWMLDTVLVILLLSGLIALYFGTTQAQQRSSINLLHLGKAVPKSLFFYIYVLSLVVATIALPFLLRLCTTRRVRSLSLVFLLFLCFGLLLWRYGMYYSGGLLGWTFDYYVMNPQVRVDLNATSPAVEFIKAHIPQTFRTVGVENILMPGYSPVLGIEGPSGPDAVRNRYMHEFLTESSLDVVWAWRLVVHQKTIARLQRIYDFLNIKYYLATREEPPENIPGLSLIGRFDLDVYASDSVWPRAFFTDTLATYESTKEFVNLLNIGDGQPFAAISKTDLQANPTLAQFVHDITSRQVVAARDYHLTTNTTTFTIDAPQAGIIVLSEAYLDKDFQVTVNGHPAAYFRVNHAFKGVRIDGPDIYTITYSYWPRYLTLSLWSWMVGTGILLLWLGLVWWKQTRGAEEREPQQVEFARARRHDASR